MPDYGCWPLWHHCGDQIGNIDPREIGISSGLADDLERWADVYESHLNWSDPASTKWTQEEEVQFDSQGRQLCRRLAAEAGSRFSFFYFEPQSASCIPVEALSDTRGPIQPPQTTTGSSAPDRV